MSWTAVGQTNNLAVENGPVETETDQGTTQREEGSHRIEKEHHRSRVARGNRLRKRDRRKRRPIISPPL
jgi:hypothetical protein